MKTLREVRFGMNVHGQLFGWDGELKDEFFGHNIVVNTGLYHIADQLASSPAQDPMGWMAIGTGTTAGSAATSTLETEPANARVALDSFLASNAVVTYVATFPAGSGTGAITEAGIFNADTAGVMLSRLVFSVINKGASDSLVITWTLTAADDGV